MMNATRDDLITERDAKHKHAGATSEKTDGLIAAKRDAVNTATAALRAANRELAEAHRIALTESHLVNLCLDKLDRELLATLPADAVEAVRRLDAGIERAREISDPDQGDVLHLRRLLALRTEAGNLHLLPTNKLKVQVAAISAALNHRDLAIA